MKGKLPPGWRWVRLGDVCRVFAGGPAPQGKDYFNGTGPYFFRVSDLSRFGRTMALLESHDRLSAKALIECQLVMVQKGTVVFPKSGAAIVTNNRAILSSDGYIVSHLIALEPSPTVLSEWLYYATCQLDMMNFSDNTGYPSLKQSSVARIEMPLPPLAEQKRIAAILNEQMAAVGRAQVAAQAQLEVAKAFSSAYLREVFPGLGQELPDGWRWMGLGDVCGDISDGTHFTPTYVDHGIPFLSVKNVRESGLEFSDCRFITREQHDHFCKRCEPARGDVLYTKVGTTGIAKTVDVDLEFSIFVSVALLKLRSFVIPDYLEKVLNAPVCRLQAEKLTQGMANRNLVLKDLKLIQIPLPPISQQERIAAHLKHRMAVVRRLQVGLQDQLAEINALPASTLRRAFAGEL